MYIKSAFLYTLCLITLSSCRKDPIEVTSYQVSQKATFSNLAYGYDAKNILDVYLPQYPKSETKAVIIIHGGGWKAGDKSDVVFIASAFADSGIVAVAINHRYADAAKGIDCNALLFDIDRSIVYLKNNSWKFGCTFSEITLIGGSSGGHLALLYTQRNNNIKNVVSVAGPTDFNDKALLAVGGMYNLIYNLVGSNNPFLWGAESPITYTSSKTFIYQNTFNKELNIHLYHGKSDCMIPCQQSVRFYDRVKTFNPNNKLVLFDNCGHGLNNEAWNRVITETIKMVKYSKF